jgi:uncharacterized protein
MVADARHSRKLWALAIVAFVAAVTVLGFFRLRIDTDILNVLPQGDPVIEGARRIVAHHPVFDTLVVELECTAEPCQTRLAAAADFVTAGLRDAGLAGHFGADVMREGFPALASHAAEQLPYLFSPHDLEARVVDQLTPARLQATLTDLYTVQGVGQTAWLMQDPFALRETVLERLGDWALAGQGEVRGGHLFSADGRHALVTARSSATGTDGANAARLAEEMTRLAEALNADFSATINLTPVGAYRAALDNESIIRVDATIAVIVATIGIIVLLLLCFSRPWLALLPLAPALMGTGLAVAVYTIFWPSISAMALGFGGALIGITVDHGIAYALVLDGKRRRTGRQAAAEIRGVGLVTTATTAGAFFALSFAPFPLMAQLGMFAGFGVLFSFLSVHVVLPFVTPTPTLRPDGPVAPLTEWFGRLARREALWPAVVGIAIVAGLAFFARPSFEADVEKMNAASPATLQAEEGIRERWGDPLARRYVFAEAATAGQLQARLGRLNETAGLGEHVASPSRFYPTAEIAAQNRASWLAFWDETRRADVAAKIDAACRGDATCAGLFRPFLQNLIDPQPYSGAMPPEVAELLGVIAAADGTRVTALLPVTSETADSVAMADVAMENGFAFYDPKLFSARLSELLGRTFLRMLAIVGAAVVVLVVLLFLDVGFVLLALAPVVAGVIGTLAVMRLLGRPIDIPGVMIATLVLGIAVDIGLLLVRPRQMLFNPREKVPSHFAAAAFLGGASTLIGMASLTVSRHPVLQSAGLTMALGIGFALAFGLFCLPPLANRLVRRTASPPVDAPHSRNHRGAVMRLFAHAPPYPRLFAWFKLRLDPMFPRLAELVGPARELVDIGAGFGVPAAWLATLIPERRIVSIEPSSQRVEVLRQVNADFGRAITGEVPGALGPLGPTDSAIFLDVAHYLDDEALTRTLDGLRKIVRPGGRVVARVTVVTGAATSWERTAENLRGKLFGIPIYWRCAEQVEAFFVTAGFDVTLVEATAPGREETWFVADVPEDAA